MNAVVERCPNCGVEHNPSHVGPCEVCGHELGYWCKRHSRDIGWLDGPECALCQREREMPPPPPPVTPPPATARPAEREPAREVRHDPRGTWERRPAPRVRPGDVLPHVATGAGLALRMVGALLVLVRTVLLWSLLGAVAGAGYAILVGGELVWIAFFGLLNGALLGLFLGFVRFLVTLFRSRHRR